ncbi:hypothetical protein O9G_002591 [Rozella allomycis CSF55]|uniref:Uncharacterized protein n=1 Tax=Rozella allomycis (strain CSF55) TaxID=988480 RepID=A0A075AUD4_ROZAC|nr:hypothetical protein O9G_002591 [Rozella allomycis CSF55]|eukprot:EPZ32097.1 hypothetical protein O9G_002591 [Rozella allomycis CSF55]
MTISDHDDTYQRCKDLLEQLKASRQKARLRGDEHLRSTKFERAWSGPFLLGKQMPLVTYQLVAPKVMVKQDLVYRDHLKPCLNLFTNNE